MEVPEGMTEAEVLAIIDKVARRLAYKFVFGSFGYDDIVQEATIIGMEGLKRYEKDRPLENYMWVHVRNRLVNFKRDNYVRLDKPCAMCPLKAYVKKGDICKIYENKGDCELYSGWLARNESKKNIISPVSMSVTTDDNDGASNEYDLGGALDNKELLAKIDREIPIFMRHIWLQARAGGKISAEEMRQLREIVLEIFEEDKDV